MNALIKQVLASRKAHGLTVEKAGDYLHYEQTLPKMAKAMGLAPHQTHLSIVVQAGNELSQSLPISRSLVMVAFLDGYALAKHVDGVKRTPSQAAIGVGGDALRANGGAFGAGAALGAAC